MSTSDSGEHTLRLLAELLRRSLAQVVTDPSAAAALGEQLADALALPTGSAERALRRALNSTVELRGWVASQLERGHIRERLMSAVADDGVPARYLSVECVEYAAMGHRVPLEVSITEQALDRSAPCQSFAVPAEGIELTLIISVTAGLRVDGALTHAVLVPERGDSERRPFLLEPRCPGFHTATVRAYVGGRPVGEQSVTIEIGDGPGADTVRSRSAAIPSVELNPKHVTLQIDELLDGYRCRLFHPGASAGGVVTRIPADLVEQVRRQLFQIATGRARRESSEMARHDLRDLGLELWRAALPDQVRQRFHDVVSGANTLSIVTDRHYDIPWELLLPSPSGQPKAPFLSELLPVFRRIKGQSYRRVLTIRRAAYVNPPSAPRDTGLEIDEIRAVLGDRVTHRLPPFSRTTDLVPYLDAGQFDLLHIACHNSGPRGSWQEFTMSDTPFYCRNLNQAVECQTLATHQPMIFFNACDTDGRPMDTAMAGWAEKFLLAGAGAFVGSTWAVRSDTARHYATALYRALSTQDSTLGQASLEARRQVSASDDDPTRLAYAIYGDIDTIVKWS